MSLPVFWNKTQCVLCEDEVSCSCLCSATAFKTYSTAFKCLLNMMKPTGTDSYVKGLAFGILLSVRRFRVAIFD